MPLILICNSCGAFNIDEAHACRRVSTDSNIPEQDNSQQVPVTNATFSRNCQKHSRDLLYDLTKLRAESGDLNAMYLHGLHEKIKGLEAERDNWKDEYFNLMKFANDFQDQRDIMREALEVILQHANSLEECDFIATKALEKCKGKSS